MVRQASMTLSLDQQAVLKARLIREMRTNTYDRSRNRVILSADRAAAFEQLRAYYTDVFATGRSEYAIPSGALVNAAKQKQLAAFFWWTAWACGTDRPGSETTYTNNWPHESLIGNVADFGRRSVECSQLRRFAGGHRWPRLVVRLAGEGTRSRSLS